MSVNEKILKALESASAHLENSMLALKKRDENSFANSLWHVAAELEYALFLFSITFQDESVLSKWKVNPELEKVEDDLILGQSQNLLKEAESLVRASRLLDAYRNAHIARHYILKIQKDRAKKKM